jgi:hypothetical protein
MVTLTITVAWDVTPYSLVYIYQRFEGSDWLHFQDKRKLPVTTRHTTSYPRRHSVQISFYYCDLINLDLFQITGGETMKFGGRSENEYGHII